MSPTNQHVQSSISEFVPNQQFFSCSIFIIYSHHSSEVLQAILIVPKYSFLSSISSYIQSILVDFLRCAPCCYMAMWGLQQFKKKKRKTNSQIAYIIEDIVVEWVTQLRNKIWRLSADDKKPWRKTRQERGIHVLRRVYRPGWDMAWMSRAPGGSCQDKLKDEKSLLCWFQHERK